MESKNLLKYLRKNISEIENDEQLKQYFLGIDIEQIGKEYYLTNKQKGIGLVFNSDKILINIHLHNGLENNYSPYFGELPNGLLFSDDINKAHKKIGILDFKSGGGEILPILGLTKPWRKYKIDNYYFHIEFHSQGESISLITLGIE